MSCKFANLRSGDTGDECQMIVCSPLRVATVSPPANLTVWSRLRIKLAANTVLYSVLQTISDTAIVGSIIGIAKLLWFEVRSGRHHIGKFGSVSLRVGQQIGIQTYLEYGISFRLASELRVDH